MNVIAHRLLHTSLPDQHPQAVGHSQLYFLLITPSHCPACHRQLTWFELVPIISWIALKGSCRSCTAPISWLYPFIEVFTLVVLASAWFALPTPYFFGYLPFICALIVSIRTDLEQMLISPWATLAIIPLGYAAAWFELLPISLGNSILASMLGYGFLWLVAAIFTRMTGKQGIGMGDFDLLALIGAFTGILGVWMTLLGASLFGTMVGGLYLITSRQDRATPIPFGPFLTIAALFYLLFGPAILSMLGLEPF